MAITVVFSGLLRFLHACHLVLAGFLEMYKLTAGLVPPQKETSLFPLTEVPAIVALVFTTDFAGRMFPS